MKDCKTILNGQKLVEFQFFIETRKRNPEYSIITIRGYLGYSERGRTANLFLTQFSVNIIRQNQLFRLGMRDAIRFEFPGQD